MIYTSAASARLLEGRYRQLLARWPVPSDHRTIPTAQGGTFVITCGPPDAPPLVLLHGALANSATWIGDVASWAAHFRVHAVDVIGEPGLSAPARPRLVTDAYTHWLDQVLDALAVPAAAFVGTSLGGWLALDYATRRPERVTALVLLAPGGVGRQKWGLVLASLLLMPFGTAGRRLAFRLVAAGAMPDASEFVDYLVAIQRNVKPRREVLPVFPDDALRGLTMPALVILGARDALLDSHGTRRRIEATMPHATIHFERTAGHVLVGHAARIQAFLTACRR